MDSNHRSKSQSLVSYLLEDSPTETGVMPVNRTQLSRFTTYDAHLRHTTSNWSGWKILKLRPHVSKTRALPLSYTLMKLGTADWIRTSEPGLRRSGSVHRRRYRLGAGCRE